MKFFLYSIITFFLQIVSLHSANLDSEIFAKFLQVPSEEVSMSRIKLGVANQVFWLEKTKIPCAVLKVYLNINFQTVKSLHKNLLKLKDQEVKVPIPLLEIELDGHPCVIYPIYEGTHPFNPSRETLISIAREMALLHKVPADFFPFQESLSKKTLMNWLQKCSNLHSERKEFLNDLLNQLDEIETDQLPKGLIHGDISPSNLLMQENVLTTFLDFDLACQTDLLSDLTRAQIFFSFDDNENFIPENCLLFQEAYESIRPLTPYEKKFFRTSLIFQLMKMFLETHYYVNEIKEVPIDIFQDLRKSQSPNALYQKLLNYSHFLCP